MKKLKGVRKANTTILFRRVGCTDAESSGHMVYGKNGNKTLGHFHSIEVVPSKAEILKKPSTLLRIWVWYRKTSASVIKLHLGL